jgi:hypothetical protein
VLIRIFDWNCLLVIQSIAMTCFLVRILKRCGYHVNLLSQHAMWACKVKGKINGGICVRVCHVRRHVERG